MSLRDELLPLIDELKGIAGELGFRRYQVWVRTTTSAGPRSGIGAKSSSDTRLLVGGQDPKVREMKRKDLVSGSPYIDAEYEIGPLTPEFAGGGVAASTIDPPRVGSTEVYFLLKGPGLPTEGQLCKKLSQHFDRPLRIVLRVRSIGREGV